MAGATGAERKGALRTYTSLSSWEAPQLTLSPHPQQSERAIRVDTCEGAWCFLPKRCISERLWSLGEVKVEEEPRSVANIGRSPTHINSASSTMLSRSVLIASPACFRTLPVPAGEAFWNARELTLPGRALTCWVGPPYVSPTQGPGPSHPA